MFTSKQDEQDKGSFLTETLKRMLFRFQEKNNIRVHAIMRIKVD